MLPDNIRRIIVYGQVVDFRKQWNGLLGVCQKYRFDPYNGDMIIFIKRDKRGIRAFCGDDLGLLMFCRRFEGDCLKFLFGKNRIISRSELDLWFRGAQYTIKREVKPWCQKNVDKS